jgi:putative hemolysin
MPVILATILLVALSISFLCSLLEACLLSLSNADVALLQSQRPRIGAIWRRFRESLQRPLSVILILNTFAHTIGAAMSGAEFERLYGERWLFVFSLALSFAMIQWTEILPKSLGARYNRSIAVLAGVPLDLATRLFTPVVAFIRLLNRPFEGKGGGRTTALQEIQALASHASASREIEPSQGRIISDATQLSTRSVREFMIPREEISCLSASMNLNEALVKAHLDAHTRYPLSEGNDVDRLLGYINFKEIVAALRTNPDNASLRGICRPLIEVGPDERVSSVLRRLIEQHQHIAAVKDASSGRTLGLLTLEDILEEPLGEFLGEFDRPPAMLHPLGEGRIMAGGGCRMDAVTRRLGLASADGEETLSEWILPRLQGPPQPGLSVQGAGFRVTLRRVRRRKVFEAVVEKT